MGTGVSIYCIKIQKYKIYKIHVCLHEILIHPPPFSIVVVEVFGHAQQLLEEIIHTCLNKYDIYICDVCVYAIWIHPPSFSMVVVVVLGHAQQLLWRGNNAYMQELI